MNRAMGRLLVIWVAGLAALWPERGSSEQVLAALGRWFGGTLIGSLWWPANGAQG